MNYINNISKSKISLSAARVRLAAKSGNRCAMTGCYKQLVIPDKESGAEAFIGEAHHIRSIDKKNSRYDPNFPVEKYDNTENLILFCSNCHKIVHDASDHYSIELLLKMKKEREEKVDNNEASIQKIEEEKQESEKDFEEFSLLPMLTEFHKRRKHWLNDRLKGVFNEFNPINYQNVFESHFPKTGLSTPVWKKDYGMMPVEYYKMNSVQNYNKSEDIDISAFENAVPSFNTDSLVVRNVLETEFAKIVLDLIKLKETQNDSCFIYENYSEIIENISPFNKPLLLLDDHTDYLIDFNSKEPNVFKDIFFARNIESVEYRKVSMNVNDVTLNIIKYHIPTKLREKYPQFSETKGIIIDQDKVEYRIKEPLRVEWRAKKDEVKVIEHDDDSSTIILDKDYFNFRCFTLAEIKNHDNTIIWKYTGKELEILKEKKKKLKKLTQL